MREEKDRQRERREMFRTVKDEILDAIRKCNRKLLVMKILSWVWLILLNPMMTGLSNDMEYRQYCTILTVLALLIQLLKSSDMD